MPQRQRRKWSRPPGSGRSLPAQYRPAGRGAERARLSGDLPKSRKSPVDGLSNDHKSEIRVRRGLGRPMGCLERLQRGRPSLDESEIGVRSGFRGSRSQKFGWAKASRGTPGASNGSLRASGGPWGASNARAPALGGTLGALKGSSARARQLQGCSAPGRLGVNSARARERRPPKPRARARCRAWWRTGQ